MVITILETQKKALKSAPNKLFNYLVRETIIDDSNEKLEVFLYNLEAFSSLLHRLDIYFDMQGIDKFIQNLGFSTVPNKEKLSVIFNQNMPNSLSFLQESGAISKKTYAHAIDQLKVNSNKAYSTITSRTPS
jgi:hypothetical protein